MVGLLESAAPLLILQQYCDTYGDQLIKRLKSIIKIVRTTYKSNLAQKRQVKAAQGKALMVYKLLEQPSILAKYTIHIQ